MDRPEWLKTIIERGNHQRLLAWLPLLMLLMFISASLWHSYTEHVSQAESKAVTLGRAVEQHATATFDRTSIALLAISQRIQPSDLDGSTISLVRRQVLNAILANQHQQTRGVVSMSLTDKNGIVVANSVGTAPGTDLGQRRYFLQLKSSPQDRVVISEVIKGKVSNRWGLQVARRIDLPGGEFGGMVVANLGLYENFERFYETLDVGYQGIITLRNQDNIVLVRFPVVEAALGRTIQGSKGTQAIDDQVKERTTRSISPIDQVDRITTIRKLTDYPLYAVVGLAYKEIVLSWLKESATLLLLTLVILPLTAWITVLTQHRVRMLQELRDTAQTLAKERDTRHALLTQEVAERTADLQQANQRLEGFLYAASHDLKGPLGRISSFSSLLEKNYRSRLEGNGLIFINFIRDNALRLSNLIDDLLAHARIDQRGYQLEPTSLKSAVQAVIARKTEEIRELGAVIRVELPETEIMADSESLTQVLNNLLENALKYSAQNPNPFIEIGGIDEGRRFRLWVRDHGIGFDMKYHDQIFGMFQRLHTYTEYAGSGIGLALVNRAMERMGGKVWAESTPGKGATFFLEFRPANNAVEA